MWTIDMKAISRFPALLGPSRAFASDRSGSMIVLFALAAPIALRLAALGTEGGALYEKKAAVQAAADQAAVSAANSFNSSNTAYTIEGKAVGRRWDSSTARAG
jgi:Flp pilus assembly protein TadG